jgi:hypothetical protein
MANPMLDFLKNGKSKKKGKKDESEKNEPKGEAKKEAKMSPKGLKAFEKKEVD